MMIFSFASKVGNSPKERRMIKLDNVLNAIEVLSTMRSTGLSHNSFLGNNTCSELVQRHCGVGLAHELERNTSTNHNLDISHISKINYATGGVGAKNTLTRIHLEMPKRPSIRKNSTPYPFLPHPFLEIYM